VRTGRTVDELAGVADEVKADVVVTGTLGTGSVVGKQGANAVEELLLGSTTNAIAAESGSDVLICTQSRVR